MSLFQNRTSRPSKSNNDAHFNSPKVVLLGQQYFDVDKIFLAFVSQSHNHIQVTPLPTYEMICPDKKPKTSKSISLKARQQLMSQEQMKMLNISQK